MSESRLNLFAERAEAAHEVMIERISDIKAQSVNAESFDPHFYAAKQMVCDGRILQV